MPTITFRPIWSRVTKSGKCPVCGKKTRRTKTFEQTINPFNLNAQGVPKTHAEIHEENHAEAKAWEPDFRHGGCK